jgi:hypothetical protein
MVIWHTTPRIHLLLFYLDSASCNGLVNKVTGYGLHSQGLVLSRSREFVLCQQTDCPWGPPWVAVDHSPESGAKIRCAQGFTTAASIYFHSLLGTLTTFTCYFDVTGFTIPSWGACDGKCLIFCFVCSQLVGRKWVHHGQQHRSNVMSKWGAIWCTKTR